MVKIHGDSKNLSSIPSGVGGVWVKSVSDLPKSINFGGETMPRHPRVHAEGLIYHVKARGNDGQKIFLSQSDYQALIEALRTVRRPRDKT